MSLTSINSALTTTNQLVAQSSKAGVAKQGNASNALSGNALRQDTFELSPAAQRKIDTVRTLRDFANSARSGETGAQETPGAVEVFSRADVTDLFAQWGDVKPGAEYDFNGDGRVDSTDLATLLSKLGQAKTESKPAGDQPFTRADIERLTDAWNNGDDPSRAVNTRYDLDGDGRVNSSDLAELLSRLGGS